MKTDTRRLGRLHRRFQTAVTLAAWKDKSRFLRNYLQEQYRDYWTRTITANMSNSKTLWSKVNLLLQEIPASSEQTRSTEVFAEFFRNKIEKIILLTVGSPPAVIQQRDTLALCVFRTVSTDEITKIMNESPAKHCSLDPAPTWLIKQLGPQLAQAIVNMCNASFVAGVLPASQNMPSSNLD